MGEARFDSIVLTWNAPQQPNGIIIGYLITYQAGGVPFSTSVGDSITGFTISPLAPGTMVSSISVRALTSAGQGPAVALPTLTTLAEQCMLCK